MFVWPSKRTYNIVQTKIGGAFIGDFLKVVLAVLGISHAFIMFCFQHNIFVYTI